jgi:hypothetical protein
VASLSFISPQRPSRSRSPRGNRHGRPHSIPDLSSGGDRRGQPAPSPAYAPAATRHLLQAPAVSASVWPGGAPCG